jgi:hypothetical protein
MSSLNRIKEAVHESITAENEAYISELLAHQANVVSKKKDETWVQKKEW